MKFKYTGREERFYPSLSLTAEPDHVYEFASDRKPEDGNWERHTTPTKKSTHAEDDDKKAGE